MSRREWEGEENILDWRGKRVIKRSEEARRGKEMLNIGGDRGLKKEVVGKRKEQT